MHTSRTGNGRLRGIGLIEIVLAVFILALSIGPIFGMLNQGRLRTVTDDRLLAVHLAARAALEEAIALAEKKGPDGIVAGSTELGSGIQVKLIESLPGLWQFTSTVTFEDGGSRKESYVLSRLWRDPACLPGRKGDRS